MTKRTALVQAQWLAWRKGLKLERRGDLLTLKVRGTRFALSQLPYDADSIGRLKIILRYHEDMPVAIRSIRSHRRRERATWVLSLSLAVSVTTYTIGTFSPETRGITGPLTVLSLVLVLLSAAALALLRVRRWERKERIRHGGS